MYEKGLPGTPVGLPAPPAPPAPGRGRAGGAKSQTKRAIPWDGHIAVVSLLNWNSVKAIDRHLLLPYFRNTSTYLEVSISGRR